MAATAVFEGATYKPENLQICYGHLVAARRDYIDDYIDKLLGKGIHGITVMTVLRQGRSIRVMIMKVTRLSDLCQYVNITVRYESCVGVFRYSRQISIERFEERQLGVDR